MRDVIKKNAGFWARARVYLAIGGVFLILGFLFGVIGFKQSNDPRAQKFLDDVKNHFEVSNEPIKLSEFQKSDWDEVCYFGWDDSDSGQAVRTYKEVVDQGGILTSSVNIKNQDYHGLFVFLKQRAVVDYIGLLSSQMRFREGFSAWFGLGSRFSGNRSCILRENAIFLMLKVAGNNGKSGTAYASILLYDERTLDKKFRKSKI